MAIKKQSKPPKVKIEKLDLIENNYVNYGKTWSVIKLIEHSKQFPVFEMPLAGIDLNRSAWSIEDLDDFIYHLNRVNKTNLEYPIIIDSYGVIADGLHRVVKAISQGDRTILAIRLETMPDADSIQNTETK